MNLGPPGINYMLLTTMRIDTIITLSHSQNYTSDGVHLFLNPLTAVVSHQSTQRFTKVIFLKSTWRTEISWSHDPSIFSWWNPSFSDGFNRRLSGDAVACPGECVLATRTAEPTVRSPGASWKIPIENGWSLGNKTRISGNPLMTAFQIVHGWGFAARRIIQVQGPVVCLNSLGVEF